MVFLFVCVFAFASVRPCDCLHGCAYVYGVVIICPLFRFLFFFHPISSSLLAPKYAGNSMRRGLEVLNIRMFYLETLIIPSFEQLKAKRTNGIEIAVYTGR